jgi:Mn2+/Fe2+ NRAMP family transporter
MNRWRDILGPGILFASAAIGVSHLVQSTRAGALYGFGLVWAVVAANVAKYPFFEFGSRYAAATGTSLIDGYRAMGRWAAWSYLVLTAATCFIVLAAVGLVTAGFLDHMLGTGSPTVVAAVLLAGSAVLLGAGAFKALDTATKVISVVLFVSTLAAFGAAWAEVPFSAVPAAPAVAYRPWSGEDLAFVIALMGWMPTAVDLASWNSLWTLERARTTGYTPTLRETLLEFNAGYLVSALLAFAFLAMGALLLYAPGRELPAAPAAFAGGLVDLYTSVLGGWSRWIIGAAAASAMLGTTIAVLDGYSRSMAHSVATVRGATASDGHVRIALAFTALLALLLIVAFPSDLRVLVDFATTVSFVIAPVIGAANLYLVLRPSFPRDARPPSWMLLLAFAGLVFLSVFAVLRLTA